MGDRALSLRFWRAAIASSDFGDEVLAHISPAHIDVDIEGELAQLGPTGYQPLRVRL